MLVLTEVYCRAFGWRVNRGSWIVNRLTVVHAHPRSVRKSVTRFFSYMGFLIWGFCLFLSWSTKGGHGRKFHSSKKSTVDFESDFFFEIPKETLNLYCQRCVTALIFVSNGRCLVAVVPSEAGSFGWPNRGKALYNAYKQECGGGTSSPI